MFFACRKGSLPTVVSVLIAAPPNSNPFATQSTITLQSATIQRHKQQKKLQPVSPMAASCREPSSVSHIPGTRMVTAVKGAPRGCGTRGHSAAKTLLDKLAEKNHI